MSDSTVKPYLISLPKAELHLHLEGSVSPETLAELSLRHPEMPPWENNRYHPSPESALPLSVAECRALYQYKDFTGFLMAFKAVSERLRDAEDYERITYELMRSLHAQGVVHAEVFVSAGIVLWRGQEFAPLFAGLERGRVRGEKEFGLSLYWIFDAVRHFGAGECEKVLDLALELREQGGASIQGIGIGGDERLAPPELFTEVYARARAAGLHLSAHAGETTGPESIAGALDALHAERLGHVLSAERDARLMQRLTGEQIPLELCPSSNLRTGVCASFADHPLRRYFDAGALVTLNSDDPAMFGCSVAGEYQVAQEHFGFSDAEARQLAVNSILASWLPQERKRELLNSFPDAE
jgi:adenosine deaminase/aminodeoxyfutalosine deaminase